MGIRSLNKFLQTRCKNLFPKSLECLRDQTIAIDAHNYLYQIINGDLLINVSDACNVFKKYNIHTIWVFDGYPPEHKKDIIKKRKNYFRTLHSKHNILMQIKSDSVSTKLNKSIDMLEKKMRKLTSNDIAQVKKYLEDNKYEYVVTNNGIEADIVCVELVKGNKANAVLSEDMDIIGILNILIGKVLDMKNI